MEYYLIYILIGWGTTDILVNGSILDGLRSYAIVKFPLLAKLLTCVRCSGFWVGILMGLLSGGIFELSFYPLGVLTSGFLVSGSSVILNALMIYLLTRNFKNRTLPDEE